MKTLIKNPLFKVVMDPGVAVFQLFLIALGTSTVLFYDSCEKGNYGNYYWENDQCTIYGDGNFTSTINANWLGARAYCKITKEESTSMIEVELMQAGTSGSYLYAGHGWLTITLNTNTAQYVSVPITNDVFTSLPETMDKNEATVFYFNDSGGRIPCEGNLILGENIVDVDGESGSFALGVDLSEVTVNINGTLIPMKGSFQISGTNVIVQESAATGSGSASGGSPPSSDCSISQSAYNAYYAGCEDLVISDCYCAAAAACAAACDDACEQENRNSALQLGKTCSY